MKNLMYFILCMIFAPHIAGAQVTVVSIYVFDHGCPHSATLKWSYENGDVRPVNLCLNRSDYVDVYTAIVPSAEEVEIELSLAIGPKGREQFFNAKETLPKVGTDSVNTRVIWFSGCESVFDGYQQSPSLKVIENPNKNTAALRSNFTDIGNLVARDATGSVVYSKTVNITDGETFYLNTDALGGVGTYFITFEGTHTENVTVVLIKN